MVFQNKLYTVRTGTAIVQFDVVRRHLRTIKILKNNFDGESRYLSISTWCWQSSFNRLAASFTSARFLACSRSSSSRRCKTWSKGSSHDYGLFEFVRVRIFVCASECVHVSVWEWVRVRVCVNVHICVCEYVCIWMCICMCICVIVHVYMWEYEYGCA